MGEKEVERFGDCIEKMLEMIWNRFGESCRVEFSQDGDSIKIKLSFKDGEIEHHQQEVLAKEEIHYSSVDIIYLKLERAIDWLSERVNN